MSLGPLTEDRLLGGRVVMRQPASGYRAATDPVLLAACVAARPGMRVLDAGCGAGAAALCLADRRAGDPRAGSSRTTPPWRARTSPRSGTAIC